jgi:alcohol dehydrogenase (cytochrome c)
MKGRALAITIVCLAAVETVSSAEPPQAFEPVTDAMLRHPNPADWLMWRRTLDSWGFSPLDQIDRRTVGKLALAWSLELDDAPSQEGIALVHDGILYFPGPLDVTYALDAATGEQIWQYRHKLPEDLGRYVPFPQTNRNLAIYGTLLIDNGANDTIYAIDARTGELAWETKVLDYRVNPSKQGSGPLVVNGRLISGRHCATQGGPNACVITAHDALTGRELWRKRTIPKPDEPGGDSWGDVPDDKRWQVGAWMVPSYDPELDLVYIGTSVTAPAPKFMLAGNDRKYLYHNSTLALNPATGETVWYYQHAVDHWDLDHAFERILLDAAVTPSPDEVPWINPRLVPGELRKVVTGIPGKTGIVYTLDRVTGEFLWARPTIEQNVVASIDPASGEVTMNPDAQFTHADQTILVCPSTNGGKNWPAGAYSPRTGSMYFPMSNTCMNSTSIAEEGTPELTYALDNETVIAPGAAGVGTIQAISASTGKLDWRYDQRAGVTALVATAGDLIFGGDVAGGFRALDARTGKVLWETNLGSPVTGHPVTFAAGGKQYVAVSTGRANLTGALARLTPDTRADGTANKLFVFTLGDD